MIIIFLLVIQGNILRYLDFYHHKTIIRWVSLVKKPQIYRGGYWAAKENRGKLALFI